MLVKGFSAITHSRGGKLSFKWNILLCMLISTKVFQLTMLYQSSGALHYLHSPRNVLSQGMNDVVDLTLGQVCFA